MQLCKWCHCNHRPLRGDYGKVEGVIKRTEWGTSDCLLIMTSFGSATLPPAPHHSHFQHHVRTKGWGIEPGWKLVSKVREYMGALFSM